MTNSESFHASQSPSPDQRSLIRDLTRLGDLYRLNIHLWALPILEDLARLPHAWTRTAASAGSNPRDGLGVTSIDGGPGGLPDLYPLPLSPDGSRFRDADFRRPTAHYASLPSIHKFLDSFAPDLGRTHFIRFQAGGYLAPHREPVSHEPETFRLFVPIFLPGKSSFYFLLDGRPIDLMPGSIYFLNSAVSHSIFSFKEDLVFLFCNVVLNERSVEKVKTSLWEQ